MSIVGIIAEFNPLHKGHEYLINEAKKLGAVACVISGNFVQRGDTAIIEKRIRAQAALACGADIILELPVLWSMSTAQNFALGGMSALKNIGCDTIIFGSECGNIETLIKAANILSSPSFSQLLKEKIRTGITFAAARQAAAEELNLESGILSGANNNLAIEYILAAKHLNYNVNFKTVTRIGAMHDSLEENEFVSASLLREKLKVQDYDFCRKYIPQDILNLFPPQSISNIKNIEVAVLSVLRTKSKAELSLLPDLSEGVENKLFNSIKIATSLEELYNEIKVKRYTLARIRRLVLSAFIGIEKDFFMKPLPYVRVLGFNKEGEQLLRNISSPFVPMVTKATDILKISDDAIKVFKTECLATDLFALSVDIPLPCGIEYTSKLLKMEF